MLLKGMIYLESTGSNPKENLKFMFQVEDSLTCSIDRAAMAYNNGVHPKHRLTGYHDFFIRQLRPGLRILDVGCGDGTVCWDIMQQVADIKIVGIDINKNNIEKAKQRYRHPNLLFIHGCAPYDLPDERFDVAILSNILEHIKDREDFLKQLIAKTSPRKILVRVPLFDRHWTIPMRKELGLPYFSDPTHYVEYTKEDFIVEINHIGLTVEHLEVRWGEIWAALKVGI